MTCIKCGMKRNLKDRVCPRCKYLFDEDRFISVEPPRAAASPSPRRASWGAGWEKIELTLSRFALLAALIPGLGHLIRGFRVRAAIYFGLVVGLMLLGVVGFASSGGQILFGLAISIHAFSVFDLTPWKSAPSAMVRARGGSS